MQHLDPDDLALLALGENLGDAVDAHVASCAQCQHEIESFKMTVGLAELSNYGEDAPQPGEHVWAAIAAELGFGSTRSGAATLTARGEASDALPDSAELPPAPDVPAQPANRSAPPGVPPTSDNASTVSTTSDAGMNGTARPDLRSVADTGSDLPPATRAAAPASSGRRWSRWAAPLAAAVVGIAIGAGAVVISQNTSEDVTVEAVAALTPVPEGPLDGTSEFGQAELVAAPTGQEVRVNAADLPPSSNAYEVWLFGDDGRMVSLGTLNGGNGTFTVPQGINTGEYRVVDVSDEAPDGNPAHSGISLIRGEFS